MPYCRSNVLRQVRDNIYSYLAQQSWKKISGGQAPRPPITIARSWTPQVLFYFHNLAPMPCMIHELYFLISMGSWLSEHPPTIFSRTTPLMGTWRVGEYGNIVTVETDNLILAIKLYFFRLHHFGNQWNEWNLLYLPNNGTSVSLHFNCMIFKRYIQKIFLNSI